MSASSGPTILDFRLSQYPGRARGNISWQREFEPQQMRSAFRDEFRRRKRTNQSKRLVSRLVNARE